VLKAELRRSRQRRFMGNYRIEDVCTHDAWLHNTKVVIDFYNQRRKELYNTKPNAAHEALVKLEDKYNIQIITQTLTTCTSVPDPDMYFTSTAN